MRQRARWAAVLAALALTGVACGSGSDEPASASPEPGIAVTLSDFAIKAAETEMPAGPVTLELTNDGPSDHSFVMVRTDLDDDDLPLVDHQVNLDELDVIAQVDALDFEAEQTLSLSPEPGAYVMFCLLTGHYESDMHAAFTVT